MCHDKHHIPTPRVARATVSRLGEPRTEAHAVSAVAFNASSGGSLLVGHASGEVALWEFRRTGWEAVKVLPDCHAAPVTSLCFLEGPALTAVSGDARGGLMMHNIAGYTSITAMFTGAC